jgi:Inhibitor of growth proteins N-terminal histone-binding
MTVVNYLGNLLIVWIDLLKQIDKMADDYLKGVRGMDGEQRKEHLNGIQKLFNQSKKFGDEKVQLALQTYEMVKVLT